MCSNTVVAVFVEGVRVGSSLCMIWRNTMKWQCETFGQMAAEKPHYMTCKLMLSRLVEIEEGHQ